MKKLQPWRDAVAVHQMGKVGSTSVRLTLRAAITDVPVYHTHVLQREDVYRNVRSGMDADIVIPEHIMDSFKLAQWLLARPKGRLHVVSLVRDPVARNISEFFQGLEKYWAGFLADDERGALESWLVRPPEEADSLPDSIVDVSRSLQRMFLEKFPIENCLPWITRQLNEPLGIDIFEIPFRKNQGYKKYIFDRHRVLFMDMERLDEIMIPALSDFLDLTSITPKSGNVGAQKSYSPLYSEFIRSIEFSKEYLDEAYQSKFTRYFYTGERIKEFRSKWRRG